MAKKPKQHSLLFLSCDLTGSTHFKQNQAKNGVRGNESPWQKTFLQFYREFPQELALKQVELGTEGLQFDLWKAVGDELILTCPVVSENDIYNAVRTWIATIKDYANNSLAGTSLGTKGGAFIATFPGPDSESSIPRNPKDETSGGDVVELNKGALAGNRSHSKYLYDFFGPSIDTGFRVLSKCSARYFTVSVEVAYALACAHLSPRPDRDEFLSEDLVLIGAEELKGVWGGQPYPLFAIDLDHGSDLNKAYSKFVSNGAAPEDVMELCRACYLSAGWPFVLYLPDAKNDAFKTLPADPLAGYKSESTVGSESVPTDARDAQDLQESAPLGQH
ncbi:hypothetical protein [Arthrobacter sp. efr-133-R2A-120]|uniref:hypothetical protein n=1 Tax=Arthrobacter sp. efr-133-R2A-120 TaxID=3040277 RepID=UPI00254F0464|nr:hypothetical protein [Arthrobacter sp. efr-133-R2A-120]